MRDAPPWFTAGLSDHKLHLSDTSLHHLDSKTKPLILGMDDLQAWKKMMRSAEIPGVVLIRIASFWQGPFGITKVWIPKTGSQWDEGVKVRSIPSIVPLLVLQR